VSPNEKIASRLAIALNPFKVEIGWVGYESVLASVMGSRRCPVGLADRLSGHKDLSRSGNPCLEEQLMGQSQIAGKMKLAVLKGGLESSDELAAKQEAGTKITCVCGIAESTHVHLERS
jgi:hypothetical protein